MLKKPSKITTYWILLKIILGILWISLATLFWVRSKEQINRIAAWWCHSVMRWIHATFKVEDPYHLKFIPNRAYIIMSNHASLLDIPALFAAFPEGIRMIAKRELFRIPIWGQAMRKAGFISIDRQNRRQAILDLKKARAKMEEGTVIWISPEGTRTRTGDLLKFKKGGFKLAFQTEAIIIPVAVLGTAAALPPDTMDLSLHANIIVRIGKPFDSRDYQSTHINQLMDDVRNAIVQAILNGRETKIEGTSN